MLLIIAVLATLSAAFLLFRFTRRPDSELSNTHFFPSEPPPNARPLFEPSRDELKLEADTRLAKHIARREYRAKAAAREAVDRAVTGWRKERDGGHAAELLRVTAESGLDGDFSRASGEIIATFRGDGIAGLTSGGLAALLDSHMRLLSTSERGNGEIFWLKQEVAKLRTGVDVEPNL
ncbi:hypothetical protein BH10ACI2_BH10ACI2_25180 [soil metagenome]